MRKNYVRLSITMALNIEKLRSHIRDISFRVCYRRRREAIDAFSSQEIDL